MNPFLQAIARVARWSWPSPSPPAPPERRPEIRPRPRTPLLLIERTKCGVCLEEVLLAAGYGSHSLLEDRPGGMKIPHRCHPASIEAWGNANRESMRRHFRVIDDATEGEKPA